MNISSKTALAALAAAVVLNGGVARASLVTQTFDFSATNVVDTAADGKPIPVDPVIGSVTVTFDPTVNVTTTVGITVNSLNLALGSPIAFNMNTANDTLDIGGAALLIGNTFSSSEDDFILAIEGAGSANPLFDVLDYVQGTGGSYFSLDGSVTLGTPPTQAVPEPATLALLGASLVGFGWLRRRRNEA